MERTNCNSVSGINGRGIMIKRILAIGAHPDDIEIGAGGTIARHVQEGHEVAFLLITNGEGGGASRSTRCEESVIAAGELGVTQVNFLSWPDRQVEANLTLIQEIESVVIGFQPTRVYIPYQEELHQDHRETCWAALSAVRNVPQILMYEGPSSFPSFKVNFWVDISQTLEEKKRSIEAHQSQGKKEIMKLEAILAMNRYRGYQCRREFAEGFSIFRMFE